MQVCGRSAEPLLDDGRLDEDQAAVNEDECTLAADDAQLSAEDGYPWQEQPEFHEDSGVCTYGRP